MDAETESRSAARDASASEALLHVALDNMPGALVYTDNDLNIVFCNGRFREMYPVPAHLLQPGAPYPDFLRYLAANGYYGAGDVEAMVARRIESLRNSSNRSFEDRTPTGRVYRILRRRVDAGGVVTVMTDVTEERQAIDELARAEAQIHVALDNMPGALVYTDDDLNIVFCNHRFQEMYPVPAHLLEPGAPYPDFLRYLARNGYYGDVDIEATVARRIESLRNPSSRSFEDRTPAGRVYRIMRRRVDAGGVVTVMTDVTEEKRAVEELAHKEGQIHVALDNMPGALVYTDDDLNIVFCNHRFREMYPAPAHLLEAGAHYPEFLRFLATSGYYGPGDIEDLIARRVESLRNPSSANFEDHAPDGRVYRIRRRRVQAGGVVTVMTDITEQKKAEDEIRDANARVTQKNAMLEGLSNKLAKYLAPQVYRSIFSGNQTVEIAAKRKKLTVFFSDIAAFTETTENLESEELTDVLNHYLTEMSVIALEHGATIDKYIGDGMLLFFGDPESRGVKEDAKACVSMAIAMQRRMRQLEQEWRGRGLDQPFRIRMGITTGFCTVGNFGSQDRMDYTIIGSEVNLAARLQSAVEPGSILLAQETNALVQELVMTEEQPPVSAKGFNKPVKTYKVVGTYDELIETGRVVLQERTGLRVLVDLSKQDRGEAIAILEEVLAQLRR